MASHVPQRPLLTTAEVAGRLKLSQRQIRRLTAELGGFRLHGARRFDPDRVDAWLAERMAAENERGPTP